MASYTPNTWTAGDTITKTKLDRLEAGAAAALAAADLPTSSTTVAGIVELATNAETTTGTDTVRAVTPAGVKAVADTKEAAGAAATAQAFAIQRANHTGTQAISTVTSLQTTLDAKAALSHTHGVTDLTATGTKDATTYLRGDNTWAVPAGGGGASDATTSTKGIVQLAGDLAGTAAAPTVPALATKANALVTQTTQTGTSYTLVIGDAGTVVESNNAAAVALTVPPNSSVAFAVGTVIGLRQYGAGQVTVTPGAGVTIRSRGPALKLAGQYAEASLTKRAVDEWVISGDLLP